MIECKICQREFKNNISLSLHIRFNHKNISNKEYYDKFLKKEGEGICLVCGNCTSFLGSIGYSKHCCCKCSAINKDTFEQYKQTSLINWGFESPMKSKTIQNKYKQSCLEHIGVNYPLQSESIKEKTKLTCLKYWGKEYVVQSEIVKNKSKQTCLDHFGVDHYSKTFEGRKFRRENCINRISIQLLNNEPVMPTIGNNERICINELQKYTKFKIERNPQIIGYFPDGYIRYLNILIEYDEKIHFTDNWNTLTQKDQIREQDLKHHLNCRIFRVKDKDWLNNKDMIIEEFKKVIQL